MTHNDLVEIENKVELAHIAEILVKDLDKQMDCFQAPQLVIIHVHAEREEQPRVSPVSTLSHQRSNLQLGYGKVDAGSPNKCPDKVVGGRTHLYTSLCVRHSTKFVNFASR